MDPQPEIQPQSQPPVSPPVTPVVADSPAPRRSRVSLFAAIGIILAGVAVLAGLVLMVYSGKSSAPAAPVAAVQPTAAPVITLAPTLTPISLDSASQTLDTANLNEVSSGLDQNSKDLNTFR